MKKQVVEQVVVEPKFVGIHVLRSVGASCMNRDEFGSPKTIQINGKTRIRFSDGSMKKVLKDYLRNDPEIGQYFQSYLTMKAPELLAKRLEDLGHDPVEAAELGADCYKVVFCKSKPDEAIELSDADVQTLVDAIVKAKGDLGGKDIGVKIPVKFGSKTLKKMAKVASDAGKEAKGFVETFVKNRPVGKEKDAALIFISKNELDWVAGKIHETGSATFGVTQNLAVEMLKDKLEAESRDGLLSRLLGRMCACIGYQQDSCLYVSHAVATHDQAPELDFFTASEEMFKVKNAAHMNYREMSSTVMYMTFILDVARLFKGSDLDLEVKQRIVAKLVTYLMRVTPNGRKATMFGDTEAAYAVVISSQAAPTSLVNAFNDQTVIQADGTGYIKSSVKALKSHAEMTVASYKEECGMEIVSDFNFGDSTTKFANEVANACIRK